MHKKMKSMQMASAMQHREPRGLMKQQGRRTNSTIDE